MPDEAKDPMLEQLLACREADPADQFLLDVMQRVQREQRRRKSILLFFGLIGALFGLVGAILLSEPITRLFAGLPVIGTMQAVLFTVAAVAFYAWFMDEDTNLAA